MSEEDGVAWACRSLDVAAGCGATASSVIPTRRGNPDLERGHEPFAEPTLRSLERVLEYGISRRQGRVFADLWDIDRFFRCACAPARAARLARINREQRWVDPVTCASCA
jgi:hypothetical protein